MIEDPGLRRRLRAGAVGARRQCRRDPVHGERVRRRRPVDPGDRHPARLLRDLRLARRTASGPRSPVSSSRLAGERWLHGLAEPAAELPADARTALVVPVYHEDPERVAARLRVVIRSLERTGHLPLFDLFILSDSRDPARIRPSRQPGRASATSRAPGPGVLSQPRREQGPQGRQHRRVLPALGAALPLFRGARCRQHHVRQHAGAAGRADGGEPGRRADPDAAAAGRRRDPVRPRAAVRRQPLRPGLRRRARLLVPGPRQLLGPQRDHPHPGVHGRRRAADACPASRRWAARS